MNTSIDSTIRVTNDIAFNKVNTDYGWLGCMSPYAIIWDGRRYPTAEHLFQCLRFRNFPHVQDSILLERSPMMAKRVARKHRAQLNRGNLWDQSPDDIAMMRQCLASKVGQHGELAERLLRTGDALLVEDCTARDYESARFWGAVRKDGKWHGQNVLGCLWMELRGELRQRPAAAALAV